MSNVSPNAKGLLSALLVLVVGFVGPPAVLVPLAQAINLSPWLTVVLVIVAWALMFVMGLLTEIWQKLKAPCIETIANTLDLAVRSKGYHSHYCNHFESEHGGLDVKGMETQGVHALGLREVFVELYFDLKPPHEISFDPLRMPTVLPVKDSSIWDFLTARNLRDQQFVVLGAPGSGKTMLLKYLGLSLIRHRQPHGIKRLITTFTRIYYFT